MIRRPLIPALTLILLLSPAVGPNGYARDGESPQEIAREKKKEERAKTKAKPKGKGKAKAPKAAPAPMSFQGGIPTEISSAFPIGREFLGVSIPSYEEEKLKSVMKADSIIRVDDRYLDLENLIIFVYDAEGEQETTISMDSAAYDLITQELASKTPATIEQEQFTMTGDRMTFDTRSQVSRLVGNVEVIIPDAGNLFPAAGLPFPGGK